MLNERWLHFSIGTSFDATILSNLTSFCLDFLSSTYIYNLLALLIVSIDLGWIVSVGRTLQLMVITVSRCPTLRLGMSVLKFFYASHKA